MAGQYVAEIQAKLTINVRPAIRQLVSDLGKAGDLAGRKAGAQFEDSFLRQASGLRAKMEARFGKFTTQVKVDADVRRAQEQLNSLRERITTTVEAEADTTRARAELELLSKRRRTTVEVDVDRNRITQSLRSFASELGNFGQILSGIGGGAGASLLPVVGVVGAIAAASVPASAAVVALASSLGIAASSALAAAPAMFGVAAAVGAVGLSFSGITSAFKAYTQEQASAASSAGTSAASTRAAAKAVAAASRAVDQAREQQARVAEDSVDRILQANQRVIDANEQVKESEENLIEVRKRAKQQLEDLADSAERSVVNEERATFRLADARAVLASLSLTKSNNEQAVSARQLREAELDVTDAELDLAEATKTRKRTAEELAVANKAGVEGSREVIQAQRAHADATQNLADAQKEAAKTQRDAARAQADAAAAVTAAMQGVADAAESAADSTGGASAAASKYAQELAKLSPAGRKFLELLIRMRGELDNTKRMAETATLPGFTSGLEKASAIIPTLNEYIVGMGRAIGSAADRLGEFIASPLFRGKLASIMRENQSAAESLSAAVVPIANAFMTMSEAAAPLVSRFAAFIKTAAESVDSWLTMKKETGELGQFFKVAGDELSKWGKIVWNVLATIFNVMKVGLPTGQAMSDSLLEATERMKKFTDSTAGQDKLREWFGTIKEATDAIQRFIGPVSQMAGALLLLGAASKVTTALKALTVGITGMGLGTFAIVGSIVALAGWLTYVALTSDRVKTSFNSLAETVKGSFGGSLGELKTTLTDIKDTFYDLTEGALAQFIDFLNDRIVPVLTDMADRLIPAFMNAWAEVKKVFEDNKDSFSVFFESLKVIAGFLAETLGPIIVGVLIMGLQSAVATITSVVTVFGLFITALRSIDNVLTWLGERWTQFWTNLNSIARSVLNLIWTMITTVFNNIVSFYTGVFNAIMTVTQMAWSTVTGVTGRALSAVWDTISGWIDGIVKAFQGMWDRVSNLFSTLGETIGAAFRKIPSLAITGLNGLIKTVNLLINAISAVPGIDIKPLDEIKLPAFAKGGAIRGAGTGTSDDILAKVSNGEFVLRAKAVKALSREYGPGFLQRMNNFDVVGGDPSTGAILEPKFASGGYVADAIEMLKKYNGRPYVFGGTLEGSGGTDCSGWVGSAWAAAQGKPNAAGRRWFDTTSVLSTGRWAPGVLKNGFNINLNPNPGMSGHISGEIGGVPFESGGGHGYCAYGPPSGPIGYFGQQYHSLDISASKNDEVKGLLGSMAAKLVGQLPQMSGWFKDLPKGIFDLVVSKLSSFDWDLFDQGGVLKNGAVGVNKSGKPEAVLTNDEWNSLKALARAGGGKGVEVHHHYERPPTATERMTANKLTRAASALL